MTDNTKFQRAMPFIEHMEAHYKRHESPKVFYADLADAIGQFSTPVLQEAAKRIIRQRVYAKWPSVAECLDAVQAVSQEAREAQRTYANEVPDGYRVTDEQAKRMLLCEEGYAAALEGYHVRIFDHIREHGKFPDQRALRQIVTDFRSPTFVDAKGREVSKDALWTEQPGELSAITVFRNAALARRKQLKEYILENYRPAASA